MRLKSLICLTVSLLLVTSSVVWAEAPGTGSSENELLLQRAQLAAIQKFSTEYAIRLDSSPTLALSSPDGLSDIQARSTDSPAPQPQIAKKPNFTFLYIVAIVLIGAGIAGIVYDLSQLTVTTDQF